MTDLPTDTTKHSPTDERRVTPEEHVTEPVPLAEARSFSRDELAWPSPSPCGAFACYRFARPDQAVAALILHEKARVVGFGEAHAPADFRGVSTVERFRRLLLPAVAPGTSYLLVELLAPPASGCEREEQTARERSDEITAGQSEGNQNQYLALGNTAASLSIVPDVLRASCEDLRRIASPEGGVLAYMETIAELFTTQLRERLKSTKKNRPLVLAYGGALHNDVAPREARASWSYGVHLSETPLANYLEIDLMLPELIVDSASFRAMPWYDTYKATEHQDETLVMEVSKRSYVVFFAPPPSRAGKAE